ncbi:Polyprenyl synthetase [mine drainage metagenome]|uniref:Polyprenyl synthetase n=1 Tax=mine drainage metagenome TaxID=410659 RepID=T1ASC5_9ZZZZ
MGTPKESRDPHASIDIVSYLKGQSKRIDDKINEYLTMADSDRYFKRLLGRSGYKYHDETLHKSIVEPALYILNQGGKRWRPAITLLIIKALGKDPEEYIEFSMISEIIHNGTLIHDDIEDNSTMRRGKECVHIKFGLDVANNLGDFLYHFPVIALKSSSKLPDDVKYRIADVADTEKLRATIGQAEDIAWHNYLVDPYKISEDNYLQMVYDKTGALASMAAKIGGIIGGAGSDTVDALGHFAASIGVAFQIQDDLLNITKSGVSENKGGTGEDITEGKVTLFVVYAIETLGQEDRERLIKILREHTTDRKLIDEAIGLIEKSGAIEHSRELQEKIIKTAWSNVDKKLPDSDAKAHLKALAEFLINRTI